MNNSLEILKTNWQKYAIFPCKGNSKIPATRNGFKGALYAQDVIAMVNAGFNPACSLVMSGLIAFDLDYHSADSTADTELKILENELGTLPKTLTQSTATGKGKHLIFSAKGIMQPKGKLSKNIDVKLNGYIMISPASINGKYYQIIDGVDDNGNFIIAELPETWINYLNKSKEKSNTKNVPRCERTMRQDFLDINVQKIFDNCEFLQYCRYNAEFLSEPEWFTMISILAPIKNSDEIIHKLSAPYPKYSYNETQKKIDKAKAFGYSQTCSYISSEYPEICKNCKSLKEKGDN